MNEGILFAIVAVVWFFSFFVGDNDASMWILRGFLTVALGIMFFEMTGIIDIVPLDPGLSRR